MAELPGELQLVNKKWELARKEDIEEFMRGFPTKNDVTVVSIIGPQGTGKSHLLNCVFGTNFTTLPRNINWTKTPTTNGIWIGRSLHHPSMVVMDVEGSDAIGNVQNEETSFEYKAALFAMTISDVMLVNLHCRDVGHNDGGCVPLLRTTFQEIARQKIGTRVVMTTIRDCRDPENTGDKEAAKQRMLEIWNSVHPQQELDDFVKVSAVLFPILPPPPQDNIEFERKCSELRKQLTPDKLIQGRHERNFKHTAEGFFAIVESTWTSIKENQFLDIPSKNLDLDTRRGRKIMADILASEEFRQKYSNFKTNMSISALPELFNTELESFLISTSERFDVAAAGLIERAKDAVKQEIRNKIFAERRSEIANVVNTKQKKAAKKAKQRIFWYMWKRVFLSILKEKFNADGVDAKIQDSVGRFENSCRGTFGSLCKDPEDDYYKFVEDCKIQFEKDLREYAERKVAKCQRIHRFCYSVVKATLDAFDFDSTACECGLFADILRRIYEYLVGQVEKDLREYAERKVAKCQRIHRFCYIVTKAAWNFVSTACECGFFAVILRRIYEYLVDQVDTPMQGPKSEQTFCARAMGTLVFFLELQEKISGKTPPKQKFRG